jgi:CRP/FNR family cyclic AMP-dependent transcriptional regulator
MSTQAKRIELLQRMPVFGAIRDEALQFLIEQTRTVQVPAGAYFFQENDQAVSMFVLEAGRAAVIKTWRGRELVLHRLAAGDCFGEMALMDLFPRSASVRAEQDCTAIELAASDLLRLFEHDAEQFALIQMNIGREISRRLRTTDELLFRACMGETDTQPAGLFRSS